MKENSLAIYVATRGASFLFIQNMTSRAQPRALSDSILLLLHNCDVRVAFSKRSVDIAKRKANWRRNSAIFESVVSKVLRNRL